MKIFNTLVIFAIAASIMSCNKDRNNSLSKSQLLEKERQAAKLPAEAKSVEVPDLFTSNKSNIQTRGVLTLRLSNTYVDDITELSLINDTTKATIVDHLPISMGLTGNKYGFRITQQAADVIVKIYPGLSDTRKKMNYGKNSLRLVAVAGNEERYNTKSFRLVDFTYLGASYMTRGNEDDVESPVISGGLTPFAQGISAASGGGSFLFTNSAHVLTH